MSYKVKKGDNLSNIAKKNGMTLQQLLKLNPQIKNANSIGIGDTITLSNQSSKVNDVANYSYGQFQPEIPTDETTSWGRNQKLNYQRSQMMDKELDKSKKFLKEGAEQGKKDRAKLVKRQTQQMKGRSPEYLITTKRQQALKPYGYTGEIDGIWGRGSEAAYKKAKEAGYDFDSDGNLVKQKTKLQSKTDNQNQNIKTVYNPQTGRYEPNLGLDKTIFGYSAVSNTITDAIWAPVKRFLNHTFGINIPAQTFNESDLTPEHYEFWQEAIERKWPKKERDAYFAKNPDAQVHKGWIGRITPELRKKGISQSDYKKYFGQNYDGPMARGLQETMFGEGISQAMGTIGSGNIVYTKDGAYLTDDWDFKGTGKFDTSDFKGVVRQFQENYGSQENDDTNPVRQFKGLIKYK